MFGPTEKMISLIFCFSVIFSTSPHDLSDVNNVYRHQKNIEFLSFCLVLLWRLLKLESSKTWTGCYMVTVSVMKELNI